MYTNNLEYVFEFTMKLKGKYEISICEINEKFMLLLYNEIHNNKSWDILKGVTWILKKFRKNETKDASYLEYFG